MSPASLVTRLNRWSEPLRSPKPSTTPGRKLFDSATTNLYPGVLRTDSGMRSTSRSAISLSDPSSVSLSASDSVWFPHSPRKPTRRGASSRDRPLRARRCDRGSHAREHAEGELVRPLCDQERLRDRLECLRGVIDRVARGELLLAFGDLLVDVLSIHLCLLVEVSEVVEERLQRGRGIGMRPDHCLDVRQRLGELRRLLRKLRRLCVERRQLFFHACAGGRIGHVVDALFHRSHERPRGFEECVVVGDVLVDVDDVAANRERSACGRRGAGVHAHPVLALRRCLRERRCVMPRCIRCDIDSRRRTGGRRHGQADLSSGLRIRETGDGDRAVRRNGLRSDGQRHRGIARIGRLRGECAREHARDAIMRYRFITVARMQRRAALSPCRSSPSPGSAGPSRCVSSRRGSPATSAAASHGPVSELSLPGCMSPGAPRAPPDIFEIWPIICCAAFWASGGNAGVTAARHAERSRCRTDTALHVRELSSSVDPRDGERIFLRAVGARDAIGARGSQESSKARRKVSQWRARLARGEMRSQGFASGARGLGAALPRAHHRTPAASPVSAQLRVRARRRPAHPRSTRGRRWSARCRPSPPAGFRSRASIARCPRDPVLPVA